MDFGQSMLQCGRYSLHMCAVCCASVLLQLCTCVRDKRDLCRGGLWPCVPSAVNLCSRCDAKASEWGALVQRRPHADGVWPMVEQWSNSCGSTGGGWQV